MKVVTTNLLNRFWKNGVKPIMSEALKKVDASRIVKSANITEEGFLMDGKTASELYAELNGKFIIVDILFTITKKTAGASGYDKITIPTNAIPNNYIPKMWSFRSGSISTLNGSQITICLVTNTELWYEYYCPNGIGSDATCQIYALCERY